MFKVGSTYEVRMIEAGEEILFWAKVAEYAHPLLKFEDTPEVEFSMDVDAGEAGTVEVPGKSYPGAVINVTSPNFISAVEQRDE